MIIREIYTLDTRGSVRVWYAEVEGRNWRTISGLQHGRRTVSAWTVCTGKQGRSHDQQAFFEAHAERAKKLAREYRETVSEVYSLPLVPMLAHKYGEHLVEWPVFCQPKLDGIRALISVDGAFSRDLQQHRNVEHITDSLRLFFSALPDVTLDGELYNHDLRDDFNRISSVVRKRNVGDEQRAESRDLIQFHVYDMFSSARPDLTFSQRRDFLRALRLRTEEGSPVVFVRTERAEGQPDLDRLYGESLSDGYEGQIVRLDRRYEHKRSWYLLKRKEFITAEFTLTNIMEGIGNWAGYAKKVEFMLPNDRRLANGERPKAGVRGNQEFTRRLLERRDELIGGQVTVRYFTPTPDGIPRFPVAVDFHPNGRTD